MESKEFLAELEALPCADLLQASKIDDPIGSDSFYSARTVVELLRAERAKLFEIQKILDAAQ